MTLVKQYNILWAAMMEELSSKIGKKGIDTGHTCEKGIKVKEEKYLEGRRITHITERVFVAGGLHYNLCIMETEELCEMIDNL